MAFQKLVIALACLVAIVALPHGTAAAEPEKPRVVELFEDEAGASIKQLTNDASADPGTARRDDEDYFSGRCSIRVTPLQRYTSRLKGWSYPIVEKPEAGREKASAELAIIGAKADALLKKNLTETKSAEVRRRIEALLVKRTDEDGLTDDHLRQLRAIRVLEQIGTSEGASCLKCFPSNH